MDGLVLAAVARLQRFIDSYNPDPDSPDDMKAWLEVEAATGVRGPVVPPQDMQAFLSAQVQMARLMGKVHGASKEVQLWHLQQRWGWGWGWGGRGAAMTRHRHRSSTPTDLPAPLSHPSTSNPPQPPAPALDRPVRQVAGAGRPAAARGRAADVR